MKKINTLNVGKLFSFTKKGPVHMVIRNEFAVEYKSYNDGKIRVWLELDRLVFLRPEWDSLYEAKWFK